MPKIKIKIEMNKTKKVFKQKPNKKDKSVYCANKMK